jgi:hypothetical protein
MHAESTRLLLDAESTRLLLDAASFETKHGSPFDFATCNGMRRRSDRH